MIGSSSSWSIFRSRVLAKLAFFVGYHSRVRAQTIAASAGSEPKDYLQQLRRLPTTRNLSYEPTSIVRYAGRKPEDVLGTSWAVLTLDKH